MPHCRSSLGETIKGACGPSWPSLCLDPGHWDRANDDMPSRLAGLNTPCYCSSLQDPLAPSNHIAVRPTPQSQTFFTFEVWRDGMDAKEAVLCNWHLAEIKLYHGFHLPSEAALCCVLRCPHFLYPFVIIVSLRDPRSRHSGGSMIHQPTRGANHADPSHSRRRPYYAVHELPVTDDIYVYIRT